ncbi:MAG: YcaO-like family protein, partial [Desulfovibrio sp.]|nr:YcaO-like family protein [Desulfovibrio sp.]
IPVYMSVCGQDAKDLLSCRKQMGKGSSPAQAMASAMMELVERYSFFSFWKNKPFCRQCRWSEAKKLFGSALIPIEHILLSVSETNLSKEDAEEIMDTVAWYFYPATDLVHDTITYLPLDWFKLLNEFNGTSAGNTAEESLLQGICELIERHVCWQIDQKQCITPTLDPESATDQTLQKLLSAFRREKINIILKDFSLNMPIPTIAALAWDPETYPTSSEIVFTAGTATSPQKACIRAVTEVAQLGGDFCSHSCYEASGLPKFTNLADLQWLLQGEQKSIQSIPNRASNDIKTELLTVAAQMNLPVYAIDTTHPKLQIPSHYTIIAGLNFRERDHHQSLGLFVGRKLVEDPIQQTQEGLKILAKHYPNAHFLPFFQGLAYLSRQDYASAQTRFEAAIAQQPDAENQGLTAFYAGYTATLQQNWQQALPLLKTAVAYAPNVKEFSNLLGVTYFKLQNYAQAKKHFLHVLELDKGSAMDLANLGVCEYHLEEDSAYEHLQAALTLDPSLQFAQDYLTKIQTKKILCPQGEED